MNLSFEPALLVGFGLALVRTATWVMVCPPFNTPMIPVRVRAGFAVALSFLLAERLAETVGPDGLGTAALIGNLLTQAIAGFAVGALVLIAFTAVQLAGDLIDHQIGFSLGAVLDPVSGNSSSPVGRLHQLLAVAIMFGINGHLLVVRGLVRSVEVAPGGVPNLGGLADAFTHSFAMMFAAAAEIALPILAALFCAEIALGLLGKAAPQLNILTLGFAARSLLAFMLLSATLILLPESVDSLVGRAVTTGIRVVAG